MAKKCPSGKKLSGGKCVGRRSSNTKKGSKILFWIIGIVVVLLIIGIVGFMFFGRGIPEPDSFDKFNDEDLKKIIRDVLGENGFVVGDLEIILEEGRVIITDLDTTSIGLIEITESTAPGQLSDTQLKEYKGVNYIFFSEDSEEFVLYINNIGNLGILVFSTNGLSDELIQRYIDTYDIDKPLLANSLEEYIEIHDRAFDVESSTFLSIAF